MDFVSQICHILKTRHDEQLNTALSKVHALDIRTPPYHHHDPSLASAALVPGAVHGILFQSELQVIKEELLQRLEEMQTYAPFYAKLKPTPGDAKFRQTLQGDTTECEPVNSSACCVAVH